MLTPQFILPLATKLVVDLFAGGGGASSGIEAALGRHVDIAINHSKDAIAMHEVNHPQTEHYCSDVFEVDPRKATRGRPVGLLHASPDCTHHSQARAGQPRSAKIRALSWVVLWWAGTVRPDVITLENVEQILQWSPLVAKRCKETGRVIKLDGSVAAPGERVPVEQQFLVPDQRHLGRNWRHFVGELRAMGYKVEWRSIVAADYGAPTTRKRLFMIARCDGLPIVWPAPTHAKVPKKGQKPWRPAAECIDWSLPTPSIFERERPLAEATMRRIAKGIRRYVLESADPFIVGIGQTGGSGDRIRAIGDPLATIVSKQEQCVAVPHVTKFRQNSVGVAMSEPLPTVTGCGTGERLGGAAPLGLSAATLIQAGYGEREGQAPRALDLMQPLGTVVAGGVKHAIATPMLVQAGHGEGSPGARRWSHGVNDIQGPLGTVTASGGGQAIAAAYLAQMNGGYFDGAGRGADEPLSTITAAERGAQQMLVAATLTHSYTSNTCGGEGDLRKPAKTITTGGHHGLLECTLSPEVEAGALRVAAFLMRYYGDGGQLGDLDQPAATITTKDRLALVTVVIKGEPYLIVDVGLRMLQPRELYAAQGFPAGYVIDRRADGSPLNKGQQTKMVGNSVSPKPMQALIEANCAELDLADALLEAA